MRFALGIATAILIATGIWLMGELEFLIPYRSVLIHRYGTTILVFVAVLYLNLIAAFYFIDFHLRLRRTGSKLQRLDQGLRGSSPISTELAERLARE